MNKNCLGCGALLQTNDKEIKGYTPKEGSPLCERCYKIKHYGISKKEDVNTSFLNDLKNNNHLIFYVTDIFNLPKEDLSNKNSFLVLNKIDALDSLNLVKLRETFKNKYPNFKDVIFVSAKKKYNIDYLTDIINKYNKTGEVYFIGLTSAGKTALIKSIYNKITGLELPLLISPVSNTTLGLIPIKINNSLTLFDTPGIKNSNTLLNNLPYKKLRKILEIGEVKPLTYRIYNDNVIEIDDILSISYKGDDNSLTIYGSNSLKIKKYRKNKNKTFDKSYKLKEREELVIDDLLFIRLIDKGEIKLSSKYDLNIYIRPSII